MGMNALEVRRRVMLAQPHEAEAVGAIASFRTDVVSALPMEFDLLPIQDLHGQANPYPAGGGKNILPTIIDTIKSINTNGTWTGNAYAYNGVTYTINTDGAGNVIGISTSGTASADSALYLVSQLVLTDPCVINGCPSGGSTTTYRIFATSIGSDTGSGVSKSQSGETTTTIRIDIKSGTNASGMTFKPMIRLATVTDATFAPYENICPITGHDGFTRTGTGKNLLSPSYSKYSNNNAYRFINNVVPKEQTAVFTISDKDTTVDVTGCYIGFVGEDLSQIGGPSTYVWVVQNGVIASKKDNVKNGKKCTNVFIYPNNQETFDKLFARWNIQVELGTVSTSFEQYVGHSYETEFHTPPGTVYGGHVRDNGDGTGTLVVDRAYIGGSDWSQYNSSNGFKAYQINNAPYSKGYGPQITKPMSNMISEYGSFSSSSMTKNIIQLPTDASNKAYMALQEDVNASDVWLTYLLLMPIEYTLSLTAIQSLIGQNHIWVDNADSVSVEYWGH